MKRLISLILVFALSGCNDLDSKQNNSPEQLDNLLDQDNFLIIAHRGASKFAPEHTISSYKKALEIGTNYIEIDLQMTSDYQLIALHDTTIDRTTNGIGSVNNMTLEEIQSYDAGSLFDTAFKDEKIPTLDEIFDAFGHDANYYIEIKNISENEGIEDKLLDLLNQYNFLNEDVPNGKIIIQSFNENILRYIHKQAPSIPLIKLQKEKEILTMTNKNFEEIYEYAIGVGPHFKYVDEEYVEQALNVGLLVHPFTVDSTDDIDKMKLLGVTGVFTNDLTATQTE